MSGILLIRYSALGDVVLATSMVQPLREAYPGARIEWVCDRSHAGLLEGVVDRLIPFDRKDPRSKELVMEDVRGRFDLAIDLQNKLWSHLVSRAAAPTRRRFVRRTPMQALESLLGRDTVLNELSAVDLYADAAGLAKAGPLQLKVSESARARAAELMGPGRWVAVAPGAAWETKRWPAERFGQVAAALKAEGFRVVLLGGPMDGPLLDAVRHVAPPDADLTAEPLTVLAAGLQRTELMIGNDSGLLHVAAAVGATPLGIFGPTSVHRWGPKPPGKALSLQLKCSPCTNHGGRTCPLQHHDCLQKLDVSQVVAEARTLLQQRA